MPWLVVDLLDLILHFAWCGQLPMSFYQLDITSSKCFLHKPAATVRTSTGCCSCQEGC